MKRGLILGAGRGPRLSVLELIKASSGGLGVGEIARQLGMSYMGVKAHCVALAKSGLLETWRSPSSKGRPVLLYRLTNAGEELFLGPPQRLATGLLREAERLFGVAAPQKLLLMYYRSEAARYRSVVGEGALPEKLAAFVKERGAEGRMPALEHSGDQGNEGWILRESHDPDAEATEVCPAAAGYQEHMVGEVLGLPVARTQAGASVVYRPRVH